MERYKIAGTPYLWVRKEGLMEFCPGCGHGLVERLIGEVVEETGQENNAVMG